MASDSLTIVKNLRSGKLFILLEEGQERYRVINPEGAIVSLPQDLFEDGSLISDTETHEKLLASPQLEAFRNFLLEQQKKYEQEKRVEQIKTAQNQSRRYFDDEPKITGQQPSKPKSRTPRGSNDTRTGVAATWSATTLVFYRPQIDRLGPKQSFRVIVDNVGEFVISKTDFQGSFSEVVLSPQYKAEGFFAYSSIPEKALRFLKK